MVIIYGKTGFHVSSKARSSRRPRDALTMGAGRAAAILPKSGIASVYVDPAAAGR
jgi:hypothetical protein